MNPADEKLLIDIPNWDKYQRQLKQNGKRQRDWIALSTRLMHDPDFFNLTIEQRYLWVMLLCHAGAVGVPMKLSASDARVLFKLRRSADFEPLINQGFITLLQDRTGQDRTGHSRRDGVAVDEHPDEKIEPEKIKSIDPADNMVWQVGVSLLGSDKTARSRLGKLVKQYGKDAVAEAIARASVNRPVEPFDYITAVLQKRPENGSNLQKNQQVMAEWLEESGNA